MAEKRQALGRGLSALIPSAPAAAPAPRERETGRPMEIDIDLLTPNPRQPRGQMADAALDDLAQSIRSNGVLQPILVRPVNGRFEIVAGERRWRAAQRAGLLKVPVAVRPIADDKLLQVALIENIQREDLNPIEEAKAYQQLASEHQMSQEEIALAVGKDRATVANYIRLLRLPAEVRNTLASGELSMGHARALVTSSDESEQRRLARDIVSRGLSVREAEALSRKTAAPNPPATVAKTDANTRAAEEQLKLTLGTRVRIMRKRTGGRIEIEFSSEDELQRLFEALTT
jgi:ParB family chromosome partitioning protein